jgi:hypothetical protein
MATRYCGDVKITITYRDCGDYAGTVSVTRGGQRYAWRFTGLNAPACGHGAGISYDSPEAYDSMARSAVSFAQYTGEGDPGWASPEVASAIGDSCDMDDIDYIVTRRKVW